MRAFFTVFRRAMRGHLFFVRLFVPIAIVMALVWIGEPLYARYVIDRMFLALGGEPVPFVFLFGIWLGIFLLFILVSAAMFFLPRFSSVSASSPTACTCWYTGN